MKNLDDIKIAIQTEFPEIELDDLSYVTEDHLSEVAKLKKIEELVYSKSLAEDDYSEITAYVNNARETARRVSGGGVEVVWQANFGGELPFDPDTACGNTNGVTFGNSPFTWERKPNGLCPDGKRKWIFIGKR